MGEVVGLTAVFRFNMNTNVLIVDVFVFFQGHRRKNWKVRKFILRDDPAYIHYYDPTKVRNAVLSSRVFLNC